jgi:hypothetical protein
MAFAGLRPVEARLWKVVQKAARVELEFLQVGSRRLRVARSVAAFVRAGERQVVVKASVLEQELGQASMLVWGPESEKLEALELKLGSARLAHFS